MGTKQAFEDISNRSKGKSYSLDKLQSYENLKQEFDRISEEILG